LRDFLDTQITQTKLSNENIVLKPAKECFRQGWQDAITGNIQPISELWEGIDAECFFLLDDLSKMYGNSLKNTAIFVPTYKQLLRKYPDD